MIEKQPSGETRVASSLFNTRTVGEIDSIGFTTLDMRTEPEKHVDSEKNAMDHMLLARTKSTCMESKIQFAHLSTIQRKFVTHYRCSQCGLLPLYYLNLAHIKRVRCSKCHQLVAFKRKGKYGKLRKEIALKLQQEIGGNLDC